jgi:hypothetical protein
MNLHGEQHDRDADCEGAAAEDELSKVPRPVSAVGRLGDVD